MTATHSLPINVCHILSGDGWGGAEAVAFNLITRQQEQDEMSVHAVLLNHGLLESRLRESGVTVDVFEESHNSFRSLIDQVKQYFENQTNHILHTHRYKENILAAKAMGAQTTAMVRTFHSIPAVGVSVGGLKMWLYRQIDFRTCRRSPDMHLVAVSRVMARQLARHLPDRPITTIHNGIRTEHDGQLQRSGEDPPLILAMGRLVPVKGFHVLLKAAAMLKREQKDFRLVVLGDGPLKDDLHKLLRRLDIQDRVELPGFADDTGAWLQKADLFVLPSLSEGIPMALLEAMAAGVPAIASDTGGVPEVIGHDRRFGELCPPGDAEALGRCLDKCLTNRNDTAAMGRQGMHRIREAFSVERMARDYHDLYKNTLKRDN